MQENKNSDADRMDRYKVLNLASFRKLLQRYEGVMTEMVEGMGEEMEYDITGDEFIAEAVELEIISKTSAQSTVWIMRSPKSLINIIESVERETYGEDIRYKIVTNRGEIWVNGDEIYSLSAYKTKLLNNCKIMLSFTLKEKGRKEEFDELLIHIIDNAVNTWVSEDTEDDRAGESILSELVKLQVVEDRDDFKNEYTILNKEGSYLIRSKTVTAVANGLGYDVSSVALERIMRPFLKERSTQLRGVEFGRVRVWSFEPWGSEL